MMVFIHLQTFFFNRVSIVPELFYMITHQYSYSLDKFYCASSMGDPPYKKKKKKDIVAEFKEFTVQSFKMMHSYNAEESLTQ